MLPKKIKAADRRSDTDISSTLLAKEEEGCQQKNKTVDRKESIPTEEAGCRQRKKPTDRRRIHSTEGIAVAGIIGFQRRMKMQREEEGC